MFPELRLTERLDVTYAFALQLVEKKPGRYDEKRLEAAFLLASDPTQFAESIAKYQTTIFDCRCPDHSFRHATCKHMLARMLEGCIFA